VPSQRPRRFALFKRGTIRLFSGLQELRASQRLIARPFQALFRLDQRGDSPYAARL
jgi:hypothetical protein